MRRFTSTVLASLLLIATVAATPVVAQSSPYDDPEVRALAEKLRAQGPFLKSAHDCTTAAGNLVTNCSFETGDFTGWVTKDMAIPFAPLGVYPAGAFATPYFPPQHTHQRDLRRRPRL